jgi:hypothetical protein
MNNEGLIDFSNITTIDIFNINKCIYIDVSHFPLMIAI